jgi:HIV Tat-specific factor 1
MTESLSLPPFDDVAHSGFSRFPSKFDTDLRVSFFKLNNKYLLKIEDGEEFEYVESLKRWVPVINDHVF